MGRYNLVCKFDDVLGQKDCPIVLLSAALTKDTNTNTLLCQIKFQNLDIRVIKAVLVNIKCIGVDKKTKIDEVQYTYLDLSVNQQDLFGSNIPIYLNSLETRNIEVSCLKIIFDDDSFWECSDKCGFTNIIPIQDISSKITDSLLKEELNVEINEYGMSINKVVSPYSVNNVKLCPCGTLYQGEICSACGKTQSWWDDVLDIYNLNKNRDNRIFELREKEKKEEERKAAEKQQLEEEKKKKTEKRVVFIKKSLPIVACVIALVIVGELSVKVFIPSSNYKKAMDYYSKEEYELAESYFDKAGNYKDSEVYEHKSREAIELQQLYDKACTYYREKEYDEARQVFYDLAEIGYKDSAKYYDEIVTLQYDLANDLFSAENYKEAYYAFDKLGNYKDSIEKKNTSINTIIKELNYNKTRWTSYVINGGVIVDTSVKPNDAPGRIEYVNKVNAALSNYPDIVAVDGQDDVCFAALKSNGNCILFNTSMGIENRDQYHIHDDIWTNMKYVTTFPRNTMCAVGVTMEGTVQYEGDEYEENLKVIKDWKNLAAISGQGDAVLGLKVDGTVIGARIYSKEDDGKLASTWKDVIQVDTGRDGVYGLKLDGTVYVEKTGMWNINEKEVEQWSNVKKIAVCGLNNCIALSEDGSLYSSNGLPDVFLNRNDIVDIFGSRYELYAELKDGTCIVESIYDYN